MKRFILLGLAAVLFTLLLPLISQLSQPAHAADDNGAQGGSIPSTGTGACKFLTSKNDECTKCFDSGGAWTAFGCVGEGGNPSDFITKFLSLGIGIGGGIAFLLILVSGFQTMTSVGNPEKLHAAKELLGGQSQACFLLYSRFLYSKLLVLIYSVYQGFCNPYGKNICTVIVYWIIYNRRTSRLCLWRCQNWHHCTSSTPLRLCLCRTRRASYGRSGRLYYAHLSWGCQKLESGKGRLTNAIIGFFLIFAAYWIVQLAGYIFGWSSIGGSGGSFQ